MKQLKYGDKLLDDESLCNVQQNKFIKKLPSLNNIVRNQKVLNRSDNCLIMNNISPWEDTEDDDDKNENFIDYIKQFQKKNQN